MKQFPYTNYVYAFKKHNLKVFHYSQGYTDIYKEIGNLFGHRAYLACSCLSRKYSKTLFITTTSAFCRSEG